MKLILILAIFLYIAYIVIQKLKDSKKEIVKSEENIGTYFTLKKFFFTQSEKSFFKELVKQNNNQYTILSKVRLEDIVSAKKSLDWKQKGIKRNYIKSKHLDFVILDIDSGNILAVIELDGKSHDIEKQGKYDAIKDTILTSVGVNFYRVRVGEIYSERIENILQEIKRA